jgi:hypothetical protein
VRLNWLPQRHGAAPATRGRAEGARAGGPTAKPQAWSNQEPESKPESDRARVPESESKGESDWLWIQESESTGESDRVWTREPESTGESDFFLTQESESTGESDSVGPGSPMDSRARIQKNRTLCAALAGCPWCLVSGVTMRGQPVFCSVLVLVNSTDGSPPVSSSLPSLAPLCLVSCRLLPLQFVQNHQRRRIPGSSTQNGEQQRVVADGSAGAKRKAAVRY